MLLRLLSRPRCLYSPALQRCISTSATSTSSSSPHPKAIDHLRNPPPTISSLPLSLSLHASTSSSPKFITFYAVAGVLTSALSFSAYLLCSPPPSDGSARSRTDQLYADIGQTLEKSKGSLRRVLDRMVQTGAAATVLWKSLASVLSSANQEVRSGFELRVAALLADIAAASEVRRSAIVGAGGGAVVDWLLDSVASPRNGGDHGAESARALAHLIADPGVCDKVLGRPNAVPNLLRFIFSFQPKRQKVIAFS